MEPSGRKESLALLAGETSMLRRIAQVLDIIASSGMGLGEVLQDYASQASMQTHAILHAARVIADGAMPEAQDITALHDAHYTVKSIQSILDRAPVAMQHNHADTIGDKEKLTCVMLLDLSQAFRTSPELGCLVAPAEAGPAFELSAIMGKTPDATSTSAV